MITNWGVKVV